jgi:hypothetical protein
VETEIRRLFVHELRHTDLKQVIGTEMTMTPTGAAVDAYGLLASLWLGEVPLTSPPMLSAFVGFVPMGRNATEFYFYPRAELLAWSGLSDEELTLLITWNDSGVTFDEIADAIENGWTR